MRVGTEAPPAARPVRDPAEDGRQEVSVRRYGARGAAMTLDSVAREDPLEIQVAGASVCVTMRTPGHDEELALGFLYAERVVRSAADVASMRHCTVLRDADAEDNVLRVTLQPGVRLDLEALRRNFYASSSCGVCGKATLENALREAPPLDDPTRFRPGFFRGLPDRLAAAQPVFARTGGLHAAGLFDSDGRPIAVREDVGRHNAVDKVIGCALREGRVPAPGHVLLVSGRISYEIAQKALAARIPAVAAVSAPSSLAVALAERAGMALVGFLRGERMNVYGRLERVRN